MSSATTSALEAAIAKSDQLEEALGFASDKIQQLRNENGLLREKLRCISCEARIEEIGVCATPNGLFRQSKQSEVHGEKNEDPRRR